MADRSNISAPAFGVRKFTIDEAQDWMAYSGVSLADVVNENETPGGKLGAVGFMRAPRGRTTAFEFAYDEVLVITRGACTVQAQGRAVTAGPGDAIYLSAGTPGSFHTDEDTELVYVASSPYGEVNRAAKDELRKRR
jgi:ethanolamine utilization protein EutQ (cupin superfamily)